MSEEQPELSEAIQDDGEAFERPADAAPVIQLVGRDGAILLVALSLWAAAEAFYAATGLGFAALLSTLDGIAVGLVFAALAHEWGHFAGARLAGGIAATRPLRAFLPIFTFDLQRSDPRAFRAMSVGGNAGHWAVVLFLLVSLPFDSPGQVALLSSAFGFAVFASATEFPIIRRTYQGKSAIESFQGLTGEKLRKNQWTGAAAGLVLFLLAV